MEPLMSASTSSAAQRARSHHSQHAARSDDHHAASSTSAAAASSGEHADHPPPLVHSGSSVAGTFSIPAPSPAYPRAPAEGSFAAQQAALSLKALTQRFYTWFRDSGMLAALQTQFRAQMVQHLPRRHLLSAQAGINAQDADFAKLGGRGKEVGLMQRAVNSLIVEYFVEFDYPFALSIFGPESGTRGDAGQLTRADILRLLRVDPQDEAGQGPSPNTWAARRIKQGLLGEDDEDDKENDSSRIQMAGVREGYDSRTHTVSKRSSGKKASWAKQSVLALLMDALATQPRKPAMFDSNCQTDEPTGSASSIDHKLKSIDDEYLDAHLREREALFPTLQEKMLKFEREQAQRFAHDLAVEKTRFVDQELARMKLEERQRYRAEEDKLRKDLRKEAEAHLGRVRREQEEVIAKYQTKERELADQLFRERQQLQENMNLVHNREVELSRKRELLEKTQLYTEQKMRESDRLMTSRATELEHLAANLQAKITSETDRVRTEWEAQVKQRDDLLAKVLDQLSGVKQNLERKMTELTETSTNLATYEKECRTLIETKNVVDIALANSQHAHSLASARVGELEARRATLEEALLTSTAKEQVCFHHLAELASVRTRLQEQAETYEETLKKLREKHGADIASDQGMAQAALQLAHQQATNMAQQWKASYTDVLEEVERRRAEEETLRQALEEQALVARELKREVAALRAGVVRQGGGYHIAALPSTVPSAAPFVSGHHLAASMPASGRPLHEAPPFPLLASVGAASHTTVTPFASATFSPSPIVHFSSSSPPLEVPAPSALPSSVAASAASLDAEFFGRQAELDAESAHLSHQLSMHASRTGVVTGAEQRHAQRENLTRAGAERNMALTEASRAYHHDQSMPALASSTAPTSSSEDSFAALAAERQRDLAAKQRAFLEQARDEETARRAQQAAEDLQRRQRDLDWQTEQVRTTREKEAVAKAAAQAEADTAQAQRDAAAAQAQRDAAAAQAQRDAAAAEQARRDAEAAEARQKQEAETKRLFEAASNAAAVDVVAAHVPPVAIATSTPSPAPITPPIAEIEEVEEVEEVDAARLAEEEALATRMRLERERAEQVERDREARLARRMEDRAAARASSDGASKIAATLAPAPVFAPTVATSDEERAAQALAEFEAEKAAKLAAIRAQQQLEAERRERKEVERQVAAQAQAEAEAQALATAAPVDASTEVYDEEATRAYYAAHPEAAGGYYDEHGAWIQLTAGSYDDAGQYQQYPADPASYADANQQYYADYADPNAHHYDAQGAYTTPASSAEHAPPPLPADDMDAISEASAEISAPPSDTEVSF